MKVQKVYYVLIWEEHSVILNTYIQLGETNGSVRIKERVFNDDSQTTYRFLPLYRLSSFLLVHVTSYKCPTSYTNEKFSYFIYTFPKYLSFTFELKRPI